MKYFGFIDVNRIVDSVTDTLLPKSLPKEKFQDDLQNFSKKIRVQFSFLQFSS